MGESGNNFSDSFSLSVYLFLSVYYSFLLSLSLVSSISQFVTVFVCQIVVPCLCVFVLQRVNKNIKLHTSLCLPWARTRVSHFDTSHIFFINRKTRIHERIRTLPEKKKKKEKRKSKNIQAKRASVVLHLKGKYIPK